MQTMTSMNYLENIKRTVFQLY